MIGIPLVELLLQQGAHVRSVSLDDPTRSHPDAEFIKKDLTILSNCRDVCRGMDFVFNLLGVKASPAMTVTKPARFLFATVMLEMNMLEAARLENVAGYMLASSVGVYAPAPILYEDDVWKSFPSPHDWFSGWSKRIGELQVEAYKVEYKWEQIAIVRPANVYGSHDNFDGENAMVVPSLIKKAISGENPLNVWGDGSTIRDFIHAKDVAKGMLLVAEKMPNEPINLGSGKGYSIKQLVECIIANLKHKPDVYWDISKPSGDKQRVLDISRAKSLGFTPQITLEQGVREVMKWYRENQNYTDLRYDVFK